MDKPYLRPRKCLFLCILFAVWLAALAWPERALAQTPVTIELVLAVDTSLSVDDTEFALQMKGIANAFRAAEIIALIGQQNGVAVTLFQWSSEIDRRYLIPWHLLHDPAGILAFADKVHNAARDPIRGFTAIGKAIEFSIHLITENAYRGRQLKIDISGDGRSNTGVLPMVARRKALARGIVINGLPILIDTYNLHVYFREKVIYGPGAFVESATDYQDFAQAFLRKLKREIAPVTSRNRLPAVAVN